MGACGAIMSSPFPTFSSDLLQTQPGLAIVRMASLLATEDGKLDDDTLDAMYDQVMRGALADVAPAKLWPELQQGLMGHAPSRMIAALRAAHALPVVLPEVAALFGIPQLNDDQTGVDIGIHVLNTLAEAAACHASLEVRFALLVMNVGKFDSPPEHLPVHYRHIERAIPRINHICDRFGVPDACRELALLALSECERVHRVSEVRAGPVAAMLERLGAFDNPMQFSQLMVVCTCDYRAYGDRSGHPYPKQVLLELARDACARIEPDSVHDDLQMARATAIAAAFNSMRWS